MTASENKMKVVAALSSQSMPKHTSAYQSFHIRMLQQSKIHIIYSKRKKSAKVKVKMYKKTEGRCQDWTFYLMGKCNGGKSKEKLVEISIAPFWFTHCVHALDIAFLKDNISEKFQKYSFLEEH